MRWEMGVRVDLALSQQLERIEWQFPSDPHPREQHGISDFGNMLTRCTSH
jgi:hypothetical protein